MFGTVVRILRDKGFGFVRVDNEHSSLEYFFHRSACGRGVFDNITEGQPVEFEEEQSERGPRATDIRVSYVTQGGATE